MVISLAEHRMGQAVPGFPRSRFQLPSNRSAPAPHAALLKTLRRARQFHTDQRPHRGAGAVFPFCGSCGCSVGCLVLVWQQAAACCDGATAATVVCGPLRTPGMAAGNLPRIRRGSGRNRSHCCSRFPPAPLRNRCDSGWRNVCCHWQKPRTWNDIGSFVEPGWHSHSGSDFSSTSCSRAAFEWVSRGSWWSVL